MRIINCSRDNSPRSSLFLPTSCIKTSRAKNSFLRSLSATTLCIAYQQLFENREYKVYEKKKFVRQKRSSINFLFSRKNGHKTAKKTTFRGQLLIRVFRASIIYALKNYLKYLYTPRIQYTS